MGGPLEDIPYQAQDYYIVPGVRSVCHDVKSADLAIQKVAVKAMADYLVSLNLIRLGDLIVPIPQHTGSATYTKLVAESVSIQTGAVVCDILRCHPHEAAYDRKAAGSHHSYMLTAEPSYPFYLEGSLPRDHPIWLLDNVVATGETLSRAMHLLPAGTQPLVYAVSWTTYERHKGRTEAMHSQHVQEAWEYYRDNCPGFKEPMRKALRKLDAYVTDIEERLARAYDPQRLRLGQADPDSFEACLEALKEFRWQHATNDSDAIPYINALAEAHEREVAQLRQKLRQYEERPAEQLLSLHLAQQRNLAEEAGNMWRLIHAVCERYPGIFDPKGISGGQTVHIRPDVDFGVRLQQCGIDVLNEFLPEPVQDQEEAR